MKKLLAGLALFLFAAAAFSTTLNPIQLLNPAGSTSGQAIVSTGASTAPAWGNVTATGLVSQAANTVVANATGSPASPTAFVMPSCSVSTSALQWTNGTGFICNTAINAASLGGATFVSPGPIGSTTASTGAFTTLSATGAITPSQTAGIVGTTTNNNANAGSVGEFGAPTDLSAVSLTNNTAANVSSISLTSGDWDVQCDVQYIAAGSTVMNSAWAMVSSTSGTSNATIGNASSIQVVHGAGIGDFVTSPEVRLQPTTTTTYYCVALTNFTTSTMTANGHMRARRPR
jgi:hypothetical protein